MSKEVETEIAGEYGSGWYTPWEWHRTTISFSLLQI